MPKQRPQPAGVMTPAAVLQQVLDLLDAPDKWTKGCEARDARGKACPANAPYAVQFDIDGAFKRCGMAGRRLPTHGLDGMRDRTAREAYKLVEQALEARKSRWLAVPDFNDAATTSWQDVRSLVAAALLAAREVVA